MNHHTQPGEWADIRLPYHLRPASLIVLTGPASGLRHDATEAIWQSAHGLGHGPKPLFDPAPIFTELPNLESLASAGRDAAEVPDAIRAHGRDVVQAALQAGRAVFLDGWCWSAWCEARGDAHPATGLKPSIIGVITGEPWEEDPLDEPVETIIDANVPIVRLPGHRGQVLLGLNYALISAGLLVSKPRDLQP